MLNSYLNKIIQWDSYQLIKSIPDNSIDLIVTDPPYDLKKGWWGWVAKWKQYLDELYTNKPTSFRFWITDEFLCECKRVCKKFHAYFFCNKNQIRQYLNFAHDNDYLFDVLVICKTNPIPMCKNTYLPDMEYIIMIREQWTCLNTNYITWSKFWIWPIYKNNFDHPTVKDVKVLDRLITNSSNEWDVVLDPFLWSGSTWVSAKALKRNFIGFELEDKYCQIAKERTGCEVITEIKNITDEKTVLDIIQTINKPIEKSRHICSHCWWKIKWKYCEDCLEEIYEK